MSKPVNASDAKGGVPRLRFPEFRSHDPWEIVALGSCGTFVRGLTYSAGDVAETGLAVLRSTNIQGGKLVLDKDVVFVNKICDNGQLLRPSDVVVCMSNGSKRLVGKSAQYLGDYSSPATVGAFCSLFRSDDRFARLIFDSEIYSDAVALAIDGGNINNLRNSDLEAVRFPRPVDRTEQQKIAACLSNLDDLIVAHADKLAALEQHKQGLLEQLFPREGETVPRLRFQKYRNDAAWDSKRLADVAHVLRGGSPRPIDEYLTESDDGLAWLKIGDVDDDAKYIVRTSQRIKRSGLSKTREIHAGDLILSNSMSFGRPYLSKVSACIHDGWLAITDLSPDASSEFMYYLLTGRACQSYFIDAAAGSGVHNLNIDIVELTTIKLPGKPEQLKIAECLASIDEMITAESDKLAALKEHKQGLLQQLFPIFDDATP